MYLMSMSRQSSSMVFMLHSRDVKSDRPSTKTECGCVLLRAIHIDYPAQISADFVFAWPITPTTKRLEFAMSHEHNVDDCVVKVDAIDICSKCFREESKNE